MSKAHVEVERTYAVRPEDLERVLALVCPISYRLLSDDRCYGRIDIGLGRSLHFYSADTTLAQRDRLRLRLRGGQVEGRHDRKIIRDDVSKTEESSGWCRGKRLRGIVRAVGPVKCAFYKERLKMLYKHRGHGEIIVAVDRLEAFDPIDPARRSETEWHIEFEGEDPDAAGSYCASAYFKTQVLPSLRPLEDADTKWLWAEALSARAFALPSDTTEALHDYVAHALGARRDGQSRLAPIAPEEPWP